jgi:hypothetical protein
MQILSRSNARILSLLLAAAALVWSGCDASGLMSSERSESLTIEYGGTAVTHTPVDGANLSSSDGRSLAADAPTGEGGVRLDLQGRAEGNLYFHPAQVPSNGSFSTDLEVTGPNGEKQSAVNVTHTRTGKNAYRVEAGIGALRADGATLELRRNDKVLFRRSLSPGDLSDGTAIGTTDKEACSWHYETVTAEDGDTVTIVETDYCYPDDEEDGENSTAKTDGVVTADASMSEKCEGRTVVQPTATDKGPFTATHIALIFEGSNVSADQVSGVEMTGAKRLAIVDGSFDEAR